MVKHADAAELRVASAEVLAVAVGAVLAAHHLPNVVPFWLPHWPACMCIIAREKSSLEVGRTREKRGGEKR